MRTAQKQVEGADNMKYEFIKTDKLLPNGKPALQVKRLSDGLLGGYVEGEHNLSQEGKCFIYDNAQVFENARVSDNAQVFGNALVNGDKIISGNALISEHAHVYDDVKVSKNERAHINARLYGDV